MIGFEDDDADSSGLTSLPPGMAKNLIYHVAIFLVTNGPSEKGIASASLFLQVNTFVTIVVRRGHN